MRPDEQDRAIAAAMKGQQRVANTLRGPACADAEVVAAFLDRRLSSRERSRWESHIAGCAYCTSLLSAAARAEEGQPRGLPVRARWWLLPAAGSVLAAATAAIFLYIRAANQEATAPSVVLAEKSADQAYRAAESKSEEVAPGSQPESSSMQSRDALKSSSAPQVMAKAKAEPPYRELANNEVGSLEAAGKVAPASAGANLPVGAPLLPLSASNMASGGAIAGAAVSRGSVAARAESADEASAVRPPDAVRWFAAFSSLDSSVRWAVGPAGAIARYTSRSGWNVQPSGVQNDLLAGSAPSTKVCWVVGRDGVVLRTTDGEHWEKLTSPATTDLTAVSAESAAAAAVTASDGHRYATTDGGVTWRSN